MTLTGIDTIRTYKTRSVDVELKEGNNIIGVIKMSRLPIEELIGYYELFEIIGENSKALFKKDVMTKMMKYMVTSIVSGNEGATPEETREFVGTHFFNLFEKFSDVNGGGMDINIPKEVKREIEKSE